MTTEIAYLKTVKKRVCIPVQYCPYCRSKRVDSRRVDVVGRTGPTSVQLYCEDCCIAGPRVDIVPGDDDKAYGTALEIAACLWNSIRFDHGEEA